MATIDIDGLTNHTRIQASTLRNGVVAAISRTARASALAAKYHFAGVRNAAAFAGDEAARRSPLPVAFLIDVQVRTAFAKLVAGKVEEARATATAAGAAFDENAVLAAQRTDAANRIEAIALGSSQAAGVKCWAITDADLIPSETAEAIFAFTAPAAAADAAVYTAQMATPSAGWTAAVVSGNAAGALTDMEASAINFAQMTENESGLSFICFSLGQVAPVRAGAQLSISSHHYLSDASSRTRCAACEKEVLGLATGEVKALWTANANLIKGAIWHSSIHFIATTLLTELAQDPATVDRLAATGYGSFSVGLPAQEDVLKRAKAYLACFNATTSTMADHGHTVSMTKLAEYVQVLEGVGRVGAFPAVRPVLSGITGTAWAPGVDSRSTMLKAYLEPVCTAAEPAASFCFGYYKEICDDAGIRPTTEEGSLLRSWALRRAGQNHLGDMNTAIACFTAYKKFLKAEAQEGRLKDMTYAA